MKTAPKKISSAEEASDNAGIVFEEGKFFHAMAFVDVKPSLVMPNGGDIMFCTWKDLKSSAWKIVWRFRYNARQGGTPWDADKKSWYGGSSDCGDAAAKENFRGAVKLISMVYPGAGEPDYLVLDSEVPQLFDVIKNANKPWLHMKVEPASPPDPSKN